MSCPCSIFDVREEQILEPSGALRVRLICNVCGELIDSKVIDEGNGGSGGARVPVVPRPEADGEGLTLGTGTG